MKNTKPLIENHEEMTEKRNRRIFLALLPALLIVLCILLYSLYSLYNAGFIGYLTNSTNSTNSPAYTFIPDENATEGSISSAPKDELVAALNEKVQEGMINISMNTSPVFASGTSKGSLMISNSVQNRYPQLVEIYTEDNTLIYTGGLSPGQKIEQSVLSVALPAGTYACTAYFTAINEQGEKVGTAGAKIKITIQS